MGENQERRQAHRQQRGLLRVQDILHAAGALFAEVGYDKTTTALIAARASMSSGSLYQFFPHKEAIAQAFAADATAQLHQVYDTIMASEVITLPLLAFVDTFIDRLVAFNRKYPGYLALELSATLSASLALVLADLHHDLMARLDALFATRWPQSTHAQRQIPLLISYRLFLTLLPLVLAGDGERQTAIVQEMKIFLYRYWEPIMRR